MKIALVQPNTATLRGTTIPPFGLMFLAGVLEKNRYEVKIFDRNLDFFVYSKLKKFKPDLVGISAFTGPNLLDVTDIAKVAKKMLKVPVVLGGVHPTLMPKQTLQNKYIDFVVMWEGEHSFLELINALKTKGDLSKIKGIAYKKDRKIIINQRRALIQNLDEIPPIPWHLVNYKKYFRFDVILITSRGCPYRCSFCYNHRFNESRWRGFSAERVLKEIARVKKLTKNKNLAFHDDNFTADKSRLFKILDQLSPEYSLFIETRINYITEEFLQPFKKFKSVWFFFGVESGSQRVLNKMNKGITIKQIITAFNLCNKHNIKTTAAVIIGTPTETRKEVDETIKLLKVIKPTRISYHIYTPYPGSVLYDEVVASGLFTPPTTLKGWAGFATDIKLSNVNISTMSSKQLKKLDNASWLKTISNIIKTGNFHKIWLRLVNYEPFAIPLLNKPDKIYSKMIKIKSTQKF